MIALFAPALVNENVKLSLVDDVLTIAYQAPDASDQTGAIASSYTYQAFQGPSFERVFQLHDNVPTESISASYADGLPKVILPTNPDPTKPA